MEKSTRKYLCSYIDKWLTEHHVSNHKFGNALGVTDVSVRRWRMGECAPDIDLLPSICDYMNVTVNELLDINNAGLTPKQMSFINKYNTDESFRKIVDSYHDDDEFRMCLGSILKLMER